VPLPGVPETYPPPPPLHPVQQWCTSGAPVAYLEIEFGLPGKVLGVGARGVPPWCTRGIPPSRGAPAVHQRRASEWRTWRLSLGCQAKSLAWEQAVSLPRGPRSSRLLSLGQLRGAGAARARGRGSAGASRPRPRRTRGLSAAQLPRRTAGVPRWGGRREEGGGKEGGAQQGRGGRNFSYRGALKAYQEAGQRSMIEKKQHGSEGRCSGATAGVPGACRGWQSRGRGWGRGLPPGSAGRGRWPHGVASGS